MNATVAVTVLVTVGVVRVVEVTLAMLPVPVVPVDTKFVPSDTSTVFAAPAAVRPVPPFRIGSAEPDKPIASVPEVVIGDPEIERNAGTDAATDVTDPVPATAA